jgi:two-component system CheB/CheR fusion protein
MVREDIVIDLGGLLHHARKNEKAVSKEGIMIHNKKSVQEITLEVVPHKIAGEIFFLVVFKEVTNKPQAENVGQKTNGRSGGQEKKIRKLEEDLVQSRSLIRTTNEEYVTTYEELQANNEEILSSNEELRSVNEELETSKEELQSSNEELTTTNEELRRRNVELDESYKELRRLNLQLEQFAFVSSHDLQEPLRKIATFSDMLMTRPEAVLTDYARDYLSKINASASRMSMLLKDFLSLVIHFNYKNAKIERVDLNAIVKNVIDDFELTIKEKKAVFNISNLPTLYALSNQMNQLFHNLISNALKFSAEDPLITITSGESAAEDFTIHKELNQKMRYVFITISDNGIGFNPKYSDKIFGLFQRLNDLKNVHGSGVGLTICKRIMDDHGGFIFVKSEENQGASFTLFFPVL